MPSLPRIAIIYKLVRLLILTISQEAYKTQVPPYSFQDIHLDYLAAKIPKNNILRYCVAYLGYNIIIYRAACARNHMCT